MRPFNPHIERLRRRVENTMLPQTAEIMVQEAQYNDAGMRGMVYTYRVLHDGSSLIPCRLDQSKHYRQADIVGQEVNVSEFDIHFPRAIIPPLNSRVVVDDVIFEIRKLTELQAWDVTTVVLAVRVNREDVSGPPPDRLTDGDTGYLLAADGVYIGL